MRIINLKKDFGDFKLSVENAEFADGMIHGLIGPNGCGKTTMAKLIIGTIPSERRDIDFGGMTARDITMTSQKPYMMRGSVMRNLTYPMKLRGVRPDEEDTARWLSLCGLADKRGAEARSLSSGQQQKLSLARALIFGPRLVIIDESLSNLDLDSVEAFEREILRIQEASPITFIIISHQLAHVRRLCDTVHFMDGGRIKVSGPPDELLSRPNEPELVRFLRHEGMSDIHPPQNELD